RGGRAAVPGGGTTRRGGGIALARGDGGRAAGGAPAPPAVGEDDRRAAGGAVPFPAGMGADPARRRGTGARRTDPPRPGNPPGPPLSDPVVPPPVAGRAFLLHRASHRRVPPAGRSGCRFPVTPPEGERPGAATRGRSGTLDGARRPAGRESA